MSPTLQFLFTVCIYVRACLPMLFLLCFLCCSAHFKMMKDVPLAGWDVAFTTEGVFLLEVSAVLSSSLHQHTAPLLV